MATATHLGGGHAADLGVVRVVEVLVVEELGRQHDRGYDDAVDVQAREQEAVALDEAVDVDERQDEALGVAARVLVDARSSPGS